MATRGPTVEVRLGEVAGGHLRELEAEVIAEVPVSLTVNGLPWLSFMCTPVDLEALAVGFLFNEGIVSRREEIERVEVCGRGDNVDVVLDRVVARPPSWRRTSGCVGGATAVALPAEPEPAGSPTPAGRGLDLEALRSSPFRLPAAAVQPLMEQLLSSQRLYATCGGVHSSALSDGQRLLAAAEDVGRHNTLDKIAGRCLLEGIPPGPRVLLTTGRVSSDMLQKAARLGAPVVVSRSSPTSLSLALAERWQLTVVGYARRGRFNVYTHPHRITGAVEPSLAKEPAA